jgi:ATP-dependent Lon protease
MTKAVSGQFVSMLFLARDIAHIVHLKTRSFSEHNTLNNFYENIIPLADDYAQQYQGRFNEALDIPLSTNESKGSIADVLEMQMQWIEDNRQSIVPRTETALHNKIDEVVALYQNTLYKLRFLK